MEYKDYKKKSNNRIRTTDSLSSNKIRDNDNSDFTGLNEEIRGPEKKEQNGLSGYEPSEKERQEKTNPKEVKRMSTGTGEVSVGVNKKQEVSVVISSGRVAKTAQDERRVDGNTAKQVNGAKQGISTNERDMNNSAVLIKSSLKKQSYGIEQKIKLAISTLHNNAVVRDVVPFLESEHADIKHAEAKQDEKALFEEIEHSIQKMKEEAAKLADRNNRNLWNIIGVSVADATEEDSDDSQDENSDKKPEDNKDKKKRKNNRIIPLNESKNDS